MNGAGERPIAVVHGHVGDGRLDDLAAVLGQQNGEMPSGAGAALCVSVDGEVVADLWTGERAPGVAWTADTGAVVWSVAKGVTALAVAQMVERGEVGLAEPLSDRWPDFGRQGKQAVTVGDVLTHRAGLSTWDDYRRTFTFESAASWSADHRAPIMECLAAAGLVHAGRTAYHAFTYGWLLDEVARRATGADIATLVRERVAAALDIELPFSGAADAAHHVAYGDTADPTLLATFSPATVTGAAMLLGRRGGIVTAADIANSEQFRGAPQPACSLVASARSLCRLYTACAMGGALDGARLLRTETLDRHRAPQSNGVDLVAGRPRRWAWGFALESGPGESFGLGPNAYGQRGLGGAMACCDPDRRVAFAYVTNAFLFSLDSDPRPLELARLVHSALAN